MADTNQTKVCPLCAEIIKAAAKICPYCRRSQNRWVFLSVYDLVMILTVLLFVSSSLMLVHWMDHGRTFSPGRDRIEVLSSQLALDATEFGTNVVVVGILSNSSPYAWTLAGKRDMEVRFFDRDGRTVDAVKPYWDEEFTILPQSDHSFRSYLDRKSIPNHASYKIYVKSAQDPRNYE